MRGHYDGKNPDGTIYYESGKAYTGVTAVGLNSILVNDPTITQVFHEKNLCVTVDDFSGSTWEFYEWDALP